MKTKTFIFLLFLTAAAGTQARGQASQTLSAFQEYYRIYYSYNKAEYLRCNVTSLTRDSVTWQQYYQWTFPFISSNGRYTCTYDSVRLVQGYSFNLALDMRLQVLGMSKPDRMNVLFPINLLDNAFRRESLALSYIIKTSQSSWMLRFIFKPGEYYSFYEVIYDPVTLLMTQQKLFYKADDGRTTELLITTSGYNRASFSTGIFDEFLYVKQTDTGYVAMPAYSNYRILDGTIKE
jgi:hypothetical protein